MGPEAHGYRSEKITAVGTNEFVGHEVPRDLCSYLIITCRGTCGCVPRVPLPL